MKRNAANLRGHKTTVWENGVRVPLLVRWPQLIKAGERQQFAGVEDLLPSLLDLAQIDPKITPHQPFTGVPLRASLADGSTHAERPELLRMKITGNGAPEANISDVTQRKFADHHLMLRGPRYSYHALPQGQSALYDILADPGETTDVKAKFPEMATAMDKRCRERWQAVIASGRSFTPEPVEKNIYLCT